MKRILHSAAVGLVCLSLLPAAFADRTAGETTDDKTLGASVKSKLIGISEVHARDINVEVYKGVVQLSGWIDSEKQKSMAIDAVRQMDGVAQVSDALVVMEGHRSFGRTLDDQRIHASVTINIGKVAGFGDTIGVAAHVRNGEILLSGFVEDDETRDAIVEAAKKTSDVKKVHNMLAVKS